MKRTLIKAAVITFAALVAAASATYIVLSAAAPAVLAGVYGNAGNYSHAAELYMRAYDADNKFENIVSAAEYAVMGKNDALIVKTVDKLIDDDDYSEYNRNSFDDALFLTSRYVAARYSLEADKCAVADVAFTLLTAYVSHNQVETLIVAAYDAKDKDTLSYISSKLDALDTSGFTDSQKAVLNSDKTIIAKALNDF
ncbi:MAG: hypothetical protein J5762_03340 [Clostridia bacterium]|nr:hypothetical protein [Clostridia bacterium]